MRYINLRLTYLLTYSILLLASYLTLNDIVTLKSGLEVTQGQ